MTSNNFFSKLYLISWKGKSALIYLLITNLELLQMCIRGITVLTFLYEPHVSNKEQHPVCFNKIVGAPIDPVILKWWKSRYTLLMMSFMCCVKFNFRLNLISLDFKLQHYWTYRCTDKFIGTNCKSLLSNFKCFIC